MRDKNRVDYAKTTGIGRSIAKSILMGPIGSGGYNRMRAAGHGRLSSALVNNVITSTAGLPISVLLTRHAEKRASKTEGTGSKKETEKPKRS